MNHSTDYLRHKTRGGNVHTQIFFLFVDEQANVFALIIFFIYQNCLKWFLYHERLGRMAERTWLDYFMIYYRKQHTCAC